MGSRGNYDKESFTAESEVLVEEAVQCLGLLHVRMPLELDNTREADMPGMRKVNETGMGVLGKPDPVAWQAMQDVMSAKARHNRISASLALAREDGQVLTSLALCRDQMACEHEGNAAIAVCERLAGSDAVVAALRAAGLKSTCGSTVPQGETNAV